MLSGNVIWVKKQWVQLETMNKTKGGDWLASIHALSAVRSRWIGSSRCVPCAAKLSSDFVRWDPIVVKRCASGQSVEFIALAKCADAHIDIRIHVCGMNTIVGQTETLGTRLRNSAVISGRWYLRIFHRTIGVVICYIVTESCSLILCKCLPFMAPSLYVGDST